MEGNRGFYMLYLNHQSAYVETMFTPLDFRPRPLSAIRHLIAATQQEITPLLDGTSLLELSVHRTLLSPPLPLDTLLSTILTGTTLYIKSIRDTITIDEYMLSNLPDSVYNTELPDASISMPDAKVPRHVFKWSSFEQDVLNWVETNHDLNARRVNRPVFVPRIIASEVPTLQPFIKDNLLDIAAISSEGVRFTGIRQVDTVGEPDFMMTKNAEVIAVIEVAGKWTLQPFIKDNLLDIAAISSEGVRFTDIREVDTVGEPDFMMTKNAEVIAVIEVAGKWTLGEPNLVENYERNRFVSGKINQLYHYLRLNHKKYGILTSYDYTWFVYRSRECSHCSAEEPAHDTVYVTRGISSSQLNPTALQSFAYFATIADITYVDSPPSSKPITRATSSTQLPSNSNSRPGTPRKSGSTRDLASNSNLDPSGTTGERQFDADNFNLNLSIGEGRCKVYLDKYEDKIIALKVADISKQPSMSEELKNELNVYELLKELQGSTIPKVLFSGRLESILYCVGMSMCGRVPETLTTTQKRHLLDTLDKIHLKGILHNDIKVKNILVDELSNPYLIDFGFASQSSSVEAFGMEKQLLIRCIDSL